MSLQFPKQLFVCIALLTVCSAAQTPVTTAQHPIAGSSEVAISVGSSSIEGPDGNIHPNFGASYGYNWSDHYALLAEYSEQALGATSTPPATPTLASAANCLTVTTGCSSTLLNGRSLQRYGAAFRYSFKSSKHEGRSTVTPYLIAGIGAFRASTASSTLSISTEDACCTTSTSTGSYTETIANTSYSTGTAFGAYEDIGGGANLYLNAHWGLRAEARLSHMMTTSTTSSTVTTMTILATSNTSTTTGLATGAIAPSPATNDDFRAAVSLFYQWGGAKTK
jgi:hypothetical protein